MFNTESSLATPTLERRILLMFDTSLALHATMLRGVAHQLHKLKSWSIYLDETAQLTRDLTNLNPAECHGIICDHTTPALAAVCQQAGLPLIDLLDGVPLPGIVKIRPDNIAVGHMAAEHFLERKFQHFAFSGFQDRVWSNERQKGYIEALSLAGYPCDVHSVDFSWAVRTPAWDAAQERLLGRWLLRLHRGTAVMACVDLRARQVIQAAQQVGLRVPEDVAVIGVNNDAYLCELTTPEISSVAIDAFEAGRRAVEYLDALVDGRSLPERDIRIDPLGVVARQSTDVLALRDRKVAIALSYIQENACQGISVQQVMAQVHASRSQMESRFRRYLGHSPQAEIRRVQVEKIRQLLADTDLSLKEIAAQTGFVYVEYMCVLFKRITGETPGQYRKNIQAQERVRALA